MAGVIASLSSQEINQKQSLKLAHKRYQPESIAISTVCINLAKRFILLKANPNKIKEVDKDDSSR